MLPLVLRLDARSKQCRLIDWALIRLSWLLLLHLRHIFDGSGFFFYHLDFLAEDYTVYILDLALCCHFSDDGAASYGDLLVEPLLFSLANQVFNYAASLAPTFNKDGADGPAA